MRTTTCLLKIFSNIFFMSDETALDMALLYRTDPRQPAYADNQLPSQTTAYTDLITLHQSGRAPVITILDHRGCNRGGANKEYTGPKANSEDDEMVLPAFLPSIAWHFINIIPLPGMCSIVHCMISPAPTWHSFHAKRKQSEQLVLV
jgi:hypothetical protein